MEAKTRSANRALVATASHRLLRLLYERTLLVLTIMFCIGIAIILWHVSRLQSNLVESVTLTHASLYAQALEEFRTLYTSEVAARAQAKGVEVTHDYAAKEGAIPLPVTLTIQLGEHIAAKGTGGQPRLYSDYPFPGRQDGGPQDDFEREALRYLRQYPDQPLVRFETFRGRAALRYATADRMRASCVSCHNVHPNSPKTTWQEGDVRGVLEVIMPLDAAVAQTHANLRETFYLMAAMSLFGLGGLALMIGTVRRYTADAQHFAEEATRANEVNRLKTEFVTLVSHELRTPLTSITGHVELLLEGQGGTLTEAQRESLGVVQRNAEQLVAMIEDLLDMSRLETDRLELKRTTLDLGRLIREVASSLRPQIEAKEQRLTLHLAEELPAVSGDDDRVTQILTNLLSNAHKYTPPGGSITITARGEAGHVRVSVQDTGIGLAPDDQARLFTKFFRAQNRGTQGISGTGLGLAITRALVELHGGEITVTSALGQGSTFSFTLPAMSESEAHPSLHQHLR
jgi:signal transduction histidine kinase